MQKAALLDAVDLTGLKATAVYGCECSDGSAVSMSCTSTPSCTHNVVRFVEVDTSFTYTPVLGFPGVPSTLALKGLSRMRAGE